MIAAATILCPLGAAVLTFLLGSRASLVALAATTAGTLLGALALAGTVAARGPQRYPVGGWGAPLGIDLYADGLCALMLLVTATVGAGIGIYALTYFRGREATFWPLWFFLWAGLNALFLSADLFNLYVTLEVVGLSAVALVTLAGERDALRAAMRYLLVALAGSLFYLVGVVLLYGAFGALDIQTLAARVGSETGTSIALGMMTLGLLLKTALFPLHFWLPAAHADAPAPVSAVLSGLVVKASFYVLLRLWFELFGAVASVEAALLLGALGGAAVFWGSVAALRQRRLKLLIAYSTVAQIGYLFLLFPLACALAPAPARALAWSGGVFHALSHACAKAAMFITAGIVIETMGHDRIDRMEGIAERLPVPLFAFAVSGMTLAGLPPSGGYLAKWLLMSAATSSGQWWWTLILLGGGLFAAAYLLRVLRPALRPLPLGAPSRSVSPAGTFAAGALAMAALLLGLFAAEPMTLLGVGAPFEAEGVQRTP